jgi:phage terminase small subunit
MADLTAKQLRFVDEYLVDLNGTQAAIRAGYAEKSASVEGARLLANAKVASLVAERFAARSEKTGIDAEWVLKRLAMEATADFGDLFEDDGALKPVKDWPLIWRQGLVAGVDVVEEFETVDGKKERVGLVRKVRLSDRIKRIELIGKHVDVQAFRERVAHENPDGTPLQEQSPRALAREIAFAMAAGLKAANG